MLSILKENYTKITITSRNIKDIDSKELIDIIQVDDISDKDDIDKMSDLFNTRLEQALKMLAPLTTKSVIVRRKVPWFTCEVKDQERKLRESEKTWRKNRSEENWMNLKLECTKYNTILKSSKVQSISENVTEHEHHIKKMYRLINNIMGRMAENPKPKSGSDETLANDFANFLMDKIQEIHDALQQHDKYTPARNTNVNILSSFRVMTEDKVIKIIGVMSPKSCELDAIPSLLLKWLVTDLAKLVNTSLTLRVFAATNWKTLIIRPLLKKLGLELILANYRPVSNILFISKMVEKYALKHFIQHCNNQDLIPDYQIAYRSRYSTETALVKITNDILWSFEKQHASALIVMNLSTALDTVDCQILLDILENGFGITETALSWFWTYLQPRFSKECISKSYSKPWDLAFSVPQGSCAGPIL